MTEKEAFEAAIDAAPDDNHAKLVFADWLEERGLGEEAGQYRRLARGLSVSLPVGRLGQDGVLRNSWPNATVVTFHRGRAWLPDDVLRRCFHLDDVPAQSLPQMLAVAAWSLRRRLAATGTFHAARAERPRQGRTSR